jgi:uncharacterized membrane protein YbhN (UPF0104 family)
MKKFLALAAKTAVSAALLYFAVGRVNLELIGERLAQLQDEWLLAAVLVLLLQTAMISLRWHEIAWRCGAPVSLPRIFKFTMIASFFNQTLPSTVGGDAARIWLVAREGAGWAKATYSVLVDRVIGVLVLAVLVVVCLPWSFSLIQDPVGRAALLVIGVGCIFAPVIFVALGYGHWDFLERWWLTRHVTEAARIASGVLASARSGSLVGGASLVVHASTVLAAWLAAKSVAAPFELLHALLLVPPVLLIATVPLSIAGWGVRESAMVLAFAYAGLPQSDGLLVSVLIGAAMFAAGLVGGAMARYAECEHGGESCGGQNLNHSPRA